MGHASDCSSRYGFGCDCAHEEQVIKERALATVKPQPSMAHLELEEPPEGFDVLKAQRRLQERIYESMDKDFKPVSETEAEFLECFRFNTEADLAENEEIRDRLPWKEWKKEHRERIADGVPLLAEERLEIKYELIDKLHFWLNMAIRVGFTSWEEIETYYWAKNKENLNRQERSY